MEDSPEPDKTKTAEILAEDPNAKPSQTDASFLRDKRVKTADGNNQDQQFDENRASLSRPDRMKYPTNYRTNDEGELDDEKVSTEVICKCSKTNELKIEKKLKGFSSEDEMGEMGCKCKKTEKSEYDDGIEDLCSPDAMKESCNARRRSDAASNEEVHPDEDRPILFAFDNQYKQQIANNQMDHTCCTADEPCAADDWGPDHENHTGVLIVSQKEIKSRGGFKPKHGDYKSKSWYAYGGPSSQQPAPFGQYEQYSRQYDRCNYGDDDDDNVAREGFKSCESSGSETSIVCRCTPHHNCRHDKSMPCVCRKQSAKSIKSEVTSYKSSCSVTAKKSDTKSKKTTDDGRQCDCGKILTSMASNMSLSSQHTCGFCGKREAYKDNRSVKSNASIQVTPCGICGQAQSSSKHSAPNKSNAPCGGQSSGHQPPPCEECQEKPDICEDCGKKVLGKESCSRQHSEEDKLNSCYCSTHSLTCRDDPEAPCHTISSRKEKIMRLINNLTDVANCTGTFAEDRSVIIEQLFKELTYLLGRDTIDDKEKNLECCLFRMKEYLDECFLKDLPKPKKKQIGKIELYNVERDPDFAYTSSNASKHTTEADGEEEEGGGEEEHSAGGGKGGGTSGGDDDGGGGEENRDGNAEVNIVIIGEDGIIGECADCESAADTFFGDCTLCEEATPPATECAACEEETQPTECAACEEMTQATTDCNVCDEITPAPTDCNICEEETRMVRSGGPCPDSEIEPECNECQCCHCRALRCEKECRTVNKTVECAMLDPVCELRYFIDSIIFDLDAMDHVLHDKRARTKAVKPKRVNDPCKDTFPVQITQVHDIGMTSLFVSWEIFDCCGIGGYEIYIDGQLSNRLFSPCHQATVLCNVNINKEHQIVLRATPIGEELPGESGCSSSKKIVRRSQQPPDRGPGSCQPWKASVFHYNPC